MDNHSGAAWKKFTRSGRVADYIIYRNSLLAETAEDIEPEHEFPKGNGHNNDSGHRRTGDQGERDG
ncbi:MAG: hypothetical protein FWF05_00910 [Oscillospiraceae bacterium]|nr:hypothetical protein [Oscillospiraceae bacterium]